MASPSTSAPDRRRNTAKSYFQQTVCLADWWLVKAENDVQGRRLAVGGLTDRGKQAIRVFTSAPILKRYDAFTIESTDGICIILKGFINKARTLEHGFPSDVFNHFVFGFPLYWKDYDEKFVGKEPPSKDIKADKPLDQLSRKLRSANCSAMGGAQPHLDSHDKDFRSQGKTEAKGRPKSKRAKSMAVPLPKKYSVSGLQKESYCGGTCVEDHTAPELPVNCLKDEVKSLSGLIFDGSIDVPAITDKSTDYSQLSDSGGTLFACHLYNKKAQQGAKTNFDWDMSSLEKISSDTDVRAMTHSEDKGIRAIKSRSKTRKAKNKAMESPSTPASATTSRHTPAAVDNQRDTVITGKYSLLEKAEPLDTVTRQTSVPIISKVGPSATIIPETLNQDKGIREIKTKVTSYSNTCKAKNKAIELPSTPAAPTKSHHTPVAVDNQRDTTITRKNCLSEKAKAVTKQKSVPVSKETPEREKEKGWSASPQSGSFNRSRSGRLLMPTLEFWRNQRAIYNADRTITGIEEGILP